MQENQLKAKISQIIGHTIEPVIKPLTETFLVPMAAKITSTCIEGCVKMIVGFSNYIDNEMSGLRQISIERCLTVMVRDSTDWHRSPAKDAFDVAWDAYVARSNALILSSAEFVLFRAVGPITLIIPPNSYLALHPMACTPS
jgi:hypothetical protein